MTAISVLETKSLSGEAVWLQYKVIIDISVLEAAAMNFRLDYIPGVGPVLFEGSTKAYYFSDQTNADIATALSLSVEDVKHIMEMVDMGMPWEFGLPTSDGDTFEIPSPMLGAFLQGSLIDFEFAPEADDTTYASLVPVSVTGGLTLVVDSRGDEDIWNAATVANVATSRGMLETFNDNQAPGGIAKVIVETHFAKVNAAPETFAGVNAFYDLVGKINDDAITDADALAQLTTPGTGTILDGLKTALEDTAFDPIDVDDTAVFGYALVYASNDTEPGAFQVHDPVYGDQWVEMDFAGTLGNLTFDNGAGGVRSIIDIMPVMTDLGIAGSLKGAALTLLSDSPEVGALMDVLGPPIGEFLNEVTSDFVLNDYLTYLEGAVSNPLDPPESQIKIPFEIDLAGIKRVEVDEDLLGPLNYVYEMYDYKNVDADAELAVFVQTADGSYEPYFDQVVPFKNISIENHTEAMLSLSTGLRADPSQVIKLMSNDIAVPSYFDTTVKMESMSGSKMIFGMEGADTLTGTGDNEKFYVTGGDTVTGDAGDDHFRINGEFAGANQITDFGNGSDTWELVLSDGMGEVVIRDTTDLGTATAHVDGITTYAAGEYGVDSGTGIIHYLGGSLDVRTYVAPPPSSKFIVTPVPLNEGETILSGRFGDIITFGVQYVGTDDMDAAETIDLESFDFRIEWEGDEYAFWGGDGGFAAESATPTNGDPTVDMKANGILITSYAGKYLGDGADEIAGTADDYIPDSQSYLSFSSAAPLGVTYNEGDYIATFMLERIDTSGATENTITLSKSNHSTPEQYWDVDDNGTPDNPDDDIYTAVMDATRPGPIDFTETYDQDTVSVSIANARGNEIANPTLYAANGTVTDGLSLVPVLKMGNLTKYEVVLNVSKPMIMNGAASVAATQGITIAGQRIFESSIFEKADLDLSSDAMAAVGASAITAATTDSGLTDISGKVQIAGASFTEHGFYRLAAEVFDDDATTTSNLSDLKLIDGLDLTIAGLAEPTSEGRYTIAEFVAIDEGTSIEFTNDDVNWITIEAVDVGDATTDDNGTPSDPGDDFEVPWSYNVNDGSDIVVLGESYYSNPGTYRDAIGAEDALGALRISVDPLGHSTSQIIAADFDVNGTVTAMDAYNILQYAVYGEQTTNYLPNWVYIDDIDEVTTVTGAADTYDNNIDMFIGTNYHIDATGVLRGDVSASYENLPPEDDVMEYNIDGINMAVSWNPVMDGATADADTDWTFNMQGPNASATLDFGIEDSNFTLSEGDIAWNEDTGFYDGVVLVRNFDIGFDELIVEIMPGAMIMNGAIDAAIDAGGTEDDIIHTANIEWDDLINDDDLGILGVRNEQISILTITDSESFASKYGGSSNNLQLLLIDTDQDGAIETGNGEFVALIDNYGGLLTPSNLFDVLTLDGLDTVVA